MRHDVYSVRSIVLCLVTFWLTWCAPTFAQSALEAGGFITTGQAFGMKCNDYDDDSHALATALQTTTGTGRKLYILPDASGHLCLLTSQVVFQALAAPPTGGYIPGPQIECVAGAGFDIQVPNASAILFQSTIPSRFLRNWSIKGCEITTRGTPAVGQVAAFEARGGAFFGVLDNLYIHGTPGDCIRLSDFGTGDPGSTQAIEIKNSILDRCTGNGIFLNATAGNPTVGMVTVRNTTITNSGGDGIRGGGIRGLNLEQTSIATNNLNGVHITTSGTGCGNIAFTQNSGSYDVNGLSGSHAGHIKFDCMSTAVISGVEFDFSVLAGYHSEYGIMLGDSATPHVVQGVTIRSNFFRHNDTSPPMASIYFNSNSSYNTAEFNVFTPLGAGQFNYQDVTGVAGQNVCIDNNHGVVTTLASCNR